MIARFRDGRIVKEHEADAIARAFGFQSAEHMDQVCAHADAERAARRVKVEAIRAVVRQENRRHRADAARSTAGTPS